MKAAAITSRGPFKKACFTAALVLLSTILCVVVSEIFLRLTVYNFKDYEVSPDAGATYHFKTAEFYNVVTMNSLNMRDGEILPKRTGEYRILCLGDSFTFGLGVNIPETYPKVLEKILRVRDERYSSINGGTGGNAYAAHQFLLATGFGFEPDMVVIQVYIGNDFYDGMARLKESPTVGSAASPTTSTHRGPLLFLKEAARGLRLHTFEYLWMQLTRVVWIDNILYQMNLRYDNRAIYLRDYPNLESRLVKQELEDLERIKRDCDEKGVGTLFVLVPEKQQIFQSRFLNDTKYDYKKPNRILKEFFKQNNAIFIDFLDVYELLPEKQVRSFYFSKDMHWTAKGHAFAAETMAKFLTQESR